MIPRFRWFAIPAFILLLLDSLISNRRRNEAKTTRRTASEDGESRNLAA